MVAYHAGVFLFLSTALAGDPGTVLAIQGPRFYCDIAAEDGLRPGDTVLLYRQVEVEVDGRTLSDPFYLGEAVAVEVGETLSLAQGEPNLMLQVGVGDVVTLEPLQRPAPGERTVAVVVPQETPETVVREVVPEDVQAYVTVAALPPDQRRAALEAWLKTYPDSSLAESVQAELGHEPMEPEEPPPPPLQLTAVSVASTAEGVDVPVSVTVPDTARVASAQLFFRRDGEVTFRQQEMVKNGDVTLRGQVPAESTVFPTVEWYVAVQDTDGALHESSVETIEVTPGLGSSRQAASDSSLGVRYEYVEFWWAEPGLDRFHHGEVDFTYRMRFHQLHAFRVGYGAFSGDGGVTAQLDRADDPAEFSQPIGWQYGYTELEVHPAPALGLMLRGTVGIDRLGLNAGVGGRVRIGYEESTNLQLGAARSWSVGDEFLVALAWNTIDRFPMTASVQVTNKPGLRSDDWGVRMVYEPRVQIRPALQAGVRLGYQLRNTNHLGPSLGGALVWSW